MVADFAEATRQWQQEGFAVVPGVVPADEIDAVAGDLSRLYGADSFDDYNQARGFGDGDPHGKQFRSSQFDGMRGFPQLGCGALNDLFGIPRPGHPYWNAATVDAMAAKYPGLDLTPWRTALPR